MEERGTPGGTPLGAALLASCAAVGQATAALRRAIEQEEIGALDGLVAERAVLLATAQGLLASFLGSFEGGPGGLPSAQRQRLLDALQEIQRQDDDLRALLTAHTQEIPALLAQLREARTMLAGYGRLGPERTSIVDQRG